MFNTREFLREQREAKADNQEEEQAPKAPPDTQFDQPHNSVSYDALEKVAQASFVANIKETIENELTATVDNFKKALLSCLAAQGSAELALLGSFLDIDSQLLDFSNLVLRALRADETYLSWLDTYAELCCALVGSVYLAEFLDIANHPVRYNSTDQTLRKTYHEEVKPAYLLMAAGSFTFTEPFLGFSFTVSPEEWSVVCSPPEDVNISYHGLTLDKFYEISKLTDSNGDYTDEGSPSLSILYGLSCVRWAVSSSSLFFFLFGSFFGFFSLLGCFSWVSLDQLAKATDETTSQVALRRLSERTYLAYYRGLTNAHQEYTTGEIASQSPGSSDEFLVEHRLTSYTRQGPELAEAVGELHKPFGLAWAPALWGVPYLSEEHQQPGLLLGFDSTALANQLAHLTATARELGYEPEEALLVGVKKYLNDFTEAHQFITGNIVNSSVVLPSPLTKGLETELNEQTANLPEEAASEFLKDSLQNHSLEYLKELLIDKLNKEPMPRWALLGAVDELVDDLVHSKAGYTLSYQPNIVRK